jgi:hypothetical protein
MNDTVSIVTYPDDIQTDALRVLTYDLTPEQSQLISNTLQNLDLPNTVIYVAKTGDDPQWVVDKKHKCVIVILNANSEDQTTAGYLLAQPNCYYFGSSKLSVANSKEILEQQHINNIMEKAINSYGI